MSDITVPLVVTHKRAKQLQTQQTNLALHATTAHWVLQTQYCVQLVITKSSQVKANATYVPRDIIAQWETRLFVQQVTTALD